MLKTSLNADLGAYIQKRQGFYILNFDKRDKTQRLAKFKKNSEQ